ncbi:MAG: AAA family ATPase [Verrucomicrobia bacterium]|nr:AAA family ATPase [Verrucomicrobiota bacterium]
MRLTRFRIQDYRCFLDSDWVNVSNPTVLVGKNEAGKTSLLKALHQFNPFKPESYSMARDWPRGLRREGADAD